MKKLSIITICKNEKDVDITLKSIVNQNFNNYELIVIDGGSEPEIINKINNFKSKIDILISENDDGIYDAVNKGIKLASGEWINLMNAGDCYHSPYVLKKIFKNISDNDAIVYGRQQEVNKEIKKKKNSKISQVIDKSFWINGNIATPATFVRRSLFIKYGYFNKKYLIASDFDKWLCFYFNGQIFRYIDVIVADFDRSGISSQKKYENIHKKERNQILQKYFLPKEIDLYKRKERKFSFFENLFSITMSFDKNFKILTVLGIKIKI